MVQQVAVPAEPWFVVETDDDITPPHRQPLADLLHANRFDDDFCARLRTAVLREVITVGGGAAPLFTVRRVR